VRLSGSLGCEHAKITRTNVVPDVVSDDGTVA
jgi:hypothetical protein